MNDPISAFLAIAAQTASFHKRIESVDASSLVDDVNAVESEALRRLNDRVQSMQVDGWHFLDSSASAMLGEQMVGNLQYLPDRNLVERDAVDRGVRPEYWNEKWIPVFSIEHGLLCIDLDPAPEGVEGQMIRVSVDGGDRRLVARSISDFCRRVVEAYEAGELRLEDQGAGLELVARDSYEFFVWSQHA
jgi:cell wall assembly regulator SMI1